MDKIILFGCFLLFVSGVVFGGIFPESEFWKVKVSDVFGMISALATAISVIVAVYFGRQGLSAWKEQTKANFNQQLVQRLALSLFKYRESMIKLRSPVMWPNEFEPENGVPDEGDFAQQRFDGTVRAYIKRQNICAQARLEVNTLLLESEFFWDNELTVMFKKLFEFEREFMSFIDIHFQSMRPDYDEADRKTFCELKKKRRDILYDKFDDEGDEFRKEFLACLEKMTSYLKSKLIS